MDQLGLRKIFIGDGHDPGPKNIRGSSRRRCVEGDEFCGGVPDGWRKNAYKKTDSYCQ
jgi:hypothetical protein